MELFQRLHELINKESRYEDEANGLLFLIRRVLVVIMPFYLLMGIYALIIGMGYEPCLIFFGGLVIYAGIFAETYTRRSKRCLLYLILSATIITGLLTLVFGWRASFQNFIYINFLILWYDPVTEKRNKILSSSLMGVAMCLISYFTPFGASILVPNTTPHFVVVYSNIIVFSVCLAIVAYHFCTQYIESEHKLMEYNKKLKEMSETDPLTGLVNRRFMQQELEEVRKSSLSEKYLFCIAIGDIDYFKKINDTYGHDAGDFILTELAKFFETYMKDKGSVARWGGEEFLFVLPKVNGDEGLRILDEMRRQIEASKFVFKDVTIEVTMTFGIDEYSEVSGIDRTIDEADKKLYLGKQSGRNRVIF